MADKTTQSPAHVKQHDQVTLHRQGVTSPDGGVGSVDKKRGINMAGYEEAIVEVHPTGGANPAFAVWWYSDHSNSWIRDETQQTFGPEGVDIPYIVVVPAKHRRMFIEVTAIASGAVDVRVAGHRNVVESM